MLYIAYWCGIRYYAWVHRIIVILIMLKCLKFLSMTETISLLSSLFLAIIAWLWILSTSWLLRPASNWAFWMLWVIIYLSNNQGSLSLQFLVSLRLVRVVEKLYAISLSEWMEILTCHAKKQLKFHVYNIYRNFHKLGLLSFLVMMLGLAHMYCLHVTIIIYFLVNCDRFWSDHEFNLLGLVGWLQSLNAKTGIFSKRMRIIHRDPTLQAQRVAAIKVFKCFYSQPFEFS